MSENEMLRDVDFEAVGNLVKSWVLGEDHLKIPDPTNSACNIVWTKPQSTNDLAAIQMLRDQFARAGTRFVIADTVTEVTVVESSESRFVLKLPSAQSLRDREIRVATQPNWLPSFYLPAVGAPPATLEEKMCLDAARIGDYTISNCAG